jgi:hypothetical protein
MQASWEPFPLSLTFQGMSLSEIQSLGDEGRADQAFAEHVVAVFDELMEK